MTFNTRDCATPGGAAAPGVKKYGTSLIGPDSRTFDTPREEPHLESSVHRCVAGVQHRLLRVDGLVPSSERGLQTQQGQQSWRRRYDWLRSLCLRHL